jgi:hypothetical protein
MSARPEAERMIAENLTELKINLNASMSEKIKKLRALLSNKHPHLTYAELFEITVDMALAKLEVNPRRALSKVFVSTKPTSSERPFSVAKESQRPLPVLSPKPFGASPDSPKASSSSETFSNEVLKTHKNGERMDLSATTRPFGQSQFSTSSIAKKPSGKLEFAKGRSPTKDSRYIPAAVRHHVWMRDHGRCTHPGCDSNHRVHYDHIVPFAFGGKSEVGNLRLLCQTHNLAHARKIFGEFEKGQWNPSKEFNKTPPKEGDLFRSEIHRQRRR